MKRALIHLLMSDYLKIILPGLIALLGTIITIFFGYRQWKRQHETSRNESFITEKHTAYKGLWEKLEEVHIKLRTEEVSDSDFNHLVLGVNSYILKNSLYLEDDDRDLSNEYLQAVRRLKEVITSSNDERARVEMQISAAINIDVIKTAKELKASVNEVDQIRDSIIERFRRIIGGSVSA